MADEFRPEEDDRIIRSENPVRARRTRRILTTAVAAVAVLGFGIVLLYAYNRGRQDGESKAPPVIQAQEGPTKIRPEAPGGMQVPDRDKEVFTRLEAEKQGQKVERLLPPPEKPMTPPLPAPPEQKTEPAAGSEAPQAGSVPPAPPKIEPPTAMKLPEPPKTEPPKADAPKPAAEAKPAPRPAAPEKIAAAPPKPAPAPKASGDWRIQLASLGTDDAARKYWAAQSAKNKDVLGPLSLKIERTEIAGKGTFHRVQASGLASKAAATDACAKLKQRKLGCLVVAP
jgi:septal ring-binding cell division protein DamX